MPVLTDWSLLKNTRGGRFQSRNAYSFLFAGLPAE
jgi:hypothetical protein